MAEKILSRSIVFLIVYLSISLFPVFVHATDWGSTGLIRVPNGRVIEDTNLRFTLSQNYPYRHIAVTFGFLPFLELNGRFVTLLDQKVEGSGWEKYGHYKDKVADFKILVLKENNLLPSVSIGVQDFHGTQLFFNEYVVASKNIGNFDVTIGYGGNLFGSIFKEKHTAVRELDGVFGGLEWKVMKNLSLLAEYDPTEKLARKSKEEVKSHVNFGIKWNPKEWLEIGYSFQRGYEHGICFSITWPFGKPLSAKKPDYPFYGPVDHMPIVPVLMERNITDRLKSIVEYLQEEGLSNVKVTISEDLKNLYVEYENKKYLSHVKALGRALRVIVCQCPSDVDSVHVIIKSQGLKMAEVIVNPWDFIDFLNGKITSKEMLKRTEIHTQITPYGEKSGFSDITAGKDAGFQFSKEFNPISIETYFNDPSGFWKARIGPSIDLKGEFENGLSGEAFVRLPVWSNVSTNLSPITKNPIRSDIVDYMSETKPVVEQLYLNKISKIGANDYLRLTGGFLELQFAGFSSEYLKTFFDGKLGIGSELTWAKKREPGSIFGLKNFESTTSFLKGYLYIPGPELVFQADAGKFLGGDKGFRVQITRYIRGGSVFLWYAKTDTSGFTGPNRGYADKGVGFTLPLNIFKDHDCQGQYRYAFSPWSRDVGQEVSQPYTLYDYAIKFTPAYLKSHWNEITE